MEIILYVALGVALAPVVGFIFTLAFYALCIGFISALSAYTWLINLGMPRNPILK